MYNTCCSPCLFSVWENNEKSWGWQSSRSAMRSLFSTLEKERGGGEEEKHKNVSKSHSRYTEEWLPWYTFSNIEGVLLFSFCFLQKSQREVAQRPAILLYILHFKSHSSSEKLSNKWIEIDFNHFPCSGLCFTLARDFTVPVLPTWLRYYFNCYCALANETTPRVSREQNEMKNFSFSFLPILAGRFVHFLFYFHFICWCCSFAHSESPTSSIAAQLSVFASVWENKFCFNLN